MTIPTSVVDTESGLARPMEPSARHEPMGFQETLAPEIPKSYWLKSYDCNVLTTTTSRYVQRDRINTSKVRRENVNEIDNSQDRFLRRRLPANDALGYGDFGWIYTREQRRAFVRWSENVEIPDPGGDRQELFTIMQELNRQSYFAAKAENHFFNSNRQLRHCNTMHKRVADKVRPIDDPREEEEMDFGRPDWRSRAIERQELRQQDDPPEPGPYDHIFHKRHATFPRGTRCTPERLKELIHGDTLWEREIELMMQMLLNREGGLAWTWEESGRFHEDVCPPYEIKTIPHKAWQVPTFQPPKKILPIVVEMIQERLRREALEFCDSQYRNPWFLVQKKDAKYRLINNAQHINAVSIRDANLPPNTDDFSEQYAGCKILTIMDFFSGYDHVTLSKKSRDMTAFQTPLGLVRHCTMIQGATNSPGAFLRIVMKVLYRHIPFHANVFIDDIVCGGSKDNYNDELAMPGVRRFVLDHIVKLDDILYDIELAGGTIKASKSEWGMERLAMVGYEVDEFGRHPMQNKVDKIARWPECRDIHEVRMFVGIAVYYRIWVMCFAIIAKPLFQLLKLGAEWEWGENQRRAMNTIKQAIMSPPALSSIDYGEPALMVFIGVDASAEGAGAVLEQMGRDGKRHPIRFESTLWSKAESNWHSTKLECRAVVWALKKFRIWIYGVHFTIETDAQTLIAQLNRTTTELPGSLMNRWLAYILMWDFEIKHVPGKKNVVADALSRYPKEEGWEAPEEAEEDLETFIDHALMHVSTIDHLRRTPSAYVYNLETQSCNTKTATTNRILLPQYSAESEEIACFLTTLKKPSRLNRNQKQKWGKMALTFYTENGHLFKKSSRNIAIRRVVDDPDIRRTLVWEIHQQTGHRGINGVFSVLAHRYWWKGMFQIVQDTLRSCEPCQTRATQRKKDMLTSTFSWTLWEWITIDIVYMPDGKMGNRYLVVGREYVSGWVEARASRKNDSQSVAKFIYEEFICRWSMTRKLTVDGGPENKKVVADLAAIYGIHRVQTSGWNPQAQGLIEGGHKPIVNALAKLRGNWVDNLPTVLWADRCSIHESTGYSPIQLVTGQNPVLPIELCVPTWQTLPWNEVRTREQLIAIRAMQLDLRDEDLQEAIGRIARLRGANKEYWDTTKDINHDQIEVGDMVLLWDSLREVDMSRARKLHRRWLGPYRIHESYQDKNYYRLEELDGTPFKETTSGHKLKKFIQRSPEDIAETDRGHIKLWDAKKWPERHQDAEPPQKGGNQGDVQHRQLRKLQARISANREPHRRTIPQVVIEPIDIDRTQYTRYDSLSSSSDSDTESE
jgi:hypothetical protein